uniref:Ribonuclease H-like domain-containing protein n=1 Tax=Tanacetum cinerariifolium TaxID=118510 RepID=A0A699GYY2_TANCI|nr:ribonuclease H-like domain-containing protein [Tanacetum cinerariifolium]
MVRFMWLFKHKFDADGTLSCNKGRLVANGSRQLLGVDFDETFSPVIKPDTICMVFNIAVSCLFLSQKKYALQLYERAYMVNCNPSQTPVYTKSKLGLKVVHVPDLPYGTVDFGLQLYVFATISLVGYKDADWAGCPSTRMSTLDTLIVVIMTYAETGYYLLGEEYSQELPGPNDTIRDFTQGKIGMYTRFFEFANLRVLSHFGVNDYVSPITMRWFSEKDFPRDSLVDAIDGDMFLESLPNDNPTRIRRYPEEFFVLLGLNRMWYTHADRLAFYDDDEQDDAGSRQLVLRGRSKASASQSSASTWIEPVISSCLGPEPMAQYILRIVFHPVDGEAEVKVEFAQMLDEQQQRFNDRFVVLDARLDKMFKESDILGSRLGAFISAAIFDEIRHGLEARFVHGKRGTDINSVPAYNPNAVEIYVDALKALNDVSFPLLEQDEAETSTNLASGSTSSVGGVTNQFTVTQSIPYAEDAGATARDVTPVCEVETIKTNNYLARTALVIEAADTLDTTLNVSSPNLAAQNLM